MNQLQKLLTSFSFLQPTCVPFPPPPSSLCVRDVLSGRFSAHSSYWIFLCSLTFNGPVFVPAVQTVPGCVSSRKWRNEGTQSPHPPHTPSKKKKTLCVSACWATFSFLFVFFLPVCFPEGQYYHEMWSKNEERWSQTFNRCKKKSRRILNTHALLLYLENK